MRAYDCFSRLPGAWVLPSFFRIFSMNNCTIGILPNGSCLILMRMHCSYIYFVLLTGLGQHSEHSPYSLTKRSYEECAKKLSNNNVLSFEMLVKTVKKNILFPPVWKSVCAHVKVRIGTCRVISIGPKH